MILSAPVSAARRLHYGFGQLTALLDSDFWSAWASIMREFTTSVSANLADCWSARFIGILFVISYSYITDTAIFPARLVTVYGFGLAFFFVLLFRTIARGIRRELFSYGVGINNILLVGDTKTTQRLIDALGNTKVTGYRVLGVVGGVKHELHKDRPYHQYKSFAEAIEHLKG